MQQRTCHTAKHINNVKLQTKRLKNAVPPYFPTMRSTLHIPHVKMADYAPVALSEDEPSPHGSRHILSSTYLCRSRLADIKSASLAAIAVGTVIVFTCLLALYAICSGTWANHQVPLAEEVNGLVPEFMRVPRVFWNDSAYGPEVDLSKFSNKERERLLNGWDALIPAGGGFLPVEEPKKFTLPPPLQKDKPTEPYYYAVSVFHQMHCLDSILRVFLQAHPSHDDARHQGSTGGRPMSGKTDHHRAADTAHAMHCFDYLRQAIMCCGDTALEGADPYTIAQGRDNLDFGTFGVGSTHMCKDYGAIFAYARARARPAWVDTA